MSRYRIPPKSDPSLEVIIGWDAPLSTFFCNVTRCAREDDPLDVEDENLLLTGGNLRKHTSVESLQRAIMDFADIPQTVRSEMELDSMEPYEFSPIQQWVRNVLESNR